MNKFKERMLRVLHTCNYLHAAEQLDRKGDYGYEGECSFCPSIIECGDTYYVCPYDCKYSVMCGGCSGLKVDGNYLTGEARDKFLKEKAKKDSEYNLCYKEHIKKGYLIK